MKIEQSEINGIKFYHRIGTSDIKTFEEVIGKDVYRKRGNTINAGELWNDCGANVGAFTLLACSLGAEVIAYEPDPYSCEILQKNLKLNNFTAQVNQVALVHTNIKRANLYVGNNGNVWRNSLVKNWNGKGIKVDCVNFDEVVAPNTCVKMDIEGLEMPIIENTNLLFRKLIFEWSFDIDPSLERYWACLDKLRLYYDVKTNEYRDKGVTIWPKSWFPACTNVFCYEKN